MQPSISRTPCAAMLIGVQARQILAPGSRGQVLAGRSRAVYLRTADGELAWLAPPDVPMHRRGVRLAEGPPHSSAGGPYQVSSTGRLSYDATHVELNSAEAWDPPGAGGRHPTRRTERSWHLRLAQGLLPGLPLPNGYGMLLPGILNLDRAACARRAAGSIPPQGVQLALALAEACARGDLAGLLSQAGDLIGLGDGLTPSGDDFVGGLLFGLSILRQPHERQAWQHSVEYREFIRTSRRRTNEISHALLRDHAQGLGSEVLERLARVLLEQRPIEVIRQPAVGLIRLGHTTGWSLLAGAWSALALLPSRPDQAFQPDSLAASSALS